MSTSDQAWQTFLKAVETSPIEKDGIRGLSGLEHPMLAVGFDEKRRRLVLVSADLNPRHAALAQADIQAATRDLKTVMAVPVLLDFEHLSKKAAEKIRIPESEEQRWSDFDLTELSSEKKDEVLRAVQWAFDKLDLFLADDNSALKIRAIFETFESAARQDSPRPSEMGICPIPLYRLAQDDIDPLLTSNVEATKELLGHHGILQYFLPPPDHLALGLTERTAPKNVEELVDYLNRSPTIGHPFGTPELVEPTSLNAIIEALQEKEMLVEGTMGLEVGPEGQRIRSEVRFKPQESWIKRLSYLISLKVDLKWPFGS